MKEPVNTCFSSLRTPGSPGPLLSLPIRVFVSLGLMTVAVWGKLPWLLLAFSLSILFRIACRLEFRGFLIELIWMFFFSVMVTCVALTYLPTAKSTTLLAVSFLRIAVALGPTLTVARSLLPREVSYAAAGWIPASILLGIEMALRFLPQLSMEAMEVFQIQKARGAFTRGSLLFRLRALLLPFFIRLFRMADRVTFSLQMRGVDPNKSRVVVPPDQLYQAILATKKTSST